MESSSKWWLDGDVENCFHLKREEDTVQPIFSPSSCVYIYECWYHWEIPKIFLWGYDLVGFRSWQPLFVSSMNHFSIAHLPSSALLKNLETFVDTPPCIGWVAPQIGTKDITIWEIFSFVQPGHQGGRLFKHSPPMFSKSSKIERLKIPKSHTSFLFSLHIFD